MQNINEHTFLQSDAINSFYFKIQDHGEKFLK